jgi:hypothetical protein
MLRLVRACAAVAFVVIMAACAEPPNKEMNQAQGAIDAARAAGAEQYAAQEFNAAADALRRSEEAVAQNDYRLALSLAIDSRGRAQNAAKVAVDNRAKARGNAERTVAEANSTVTQARERLTDAVLAKLPRRAAADVRTALAAADTGMQEARAALERDDYTGAIEVATRASTRLRETLAAVERPAATASPRKRR